MKKLRPDLNDELSLTFTINEWAAIGASLMTMKFIEVGDDEAKQSLENVIQRIFLALGVKEDPNEVHAKIVGSL